MTNVVPFPEGAGEGQPPRRTAVGAPADDDPRFEAIFRFIDNLTIAEARVLVHRLNDRLIERLQSYGEPQR